MEGVKKSNPRAKLNEFYPRGGKIVLSTLARHTIPVSHHEIGRVQVQDQDGCGLKDIIAIQFHYNY